MSSCRRHPATRRSAVSFAQTFSVKRRGSQFEGFGFGLLGTKMLACRWGCGFGEGMHFGDEIVVLALEVDDVAVYLAVGF